MGRGGGRGGAKHSKNNCAGSIFTNAERKMDKDSEGYGTKTQRLGADSIKDFDVCSLSLQPCVDPVVTTHGILFEREAILSYILKEKQRIAQEMAKYKAFKAGKTSEEGMKRKREAEEATKKFEETECGILPSKKPKGDEKEPEEVARFDTMRSKDFKKGVFKAAGSALGIHSVLEGPGMNRQAKDSCFWIPDLTPEAAVKDPDMPDEKVRCPISGQPLRLKDLITVKFTKVDADKKLSGSHSNERFMCPVSKKQLSNAVSCAVLRNTGTVVAMDFVEKVLKKDMIDPLTGTKLSSKDIIPLQRGASGYAGGGWNLEAKKYQPTMRAF